MNSPRASRQLWLAARCLFLILSLLGVLTARGEPLVGPSATPYEGEQKSVQQTVLWDLVVLGRIDACWVCQHGPPPHVSYTRILAGKAPRGKAQGQIALAEMAARLLPEGGTPIYRSQREEICYLKTVTLPANENASVYKLIDLEEATPENLAKFQRTGKQ